MVAPSDDKVGSGSAASVSLQMSFAHGGTTVDAMTCGLDPVGALIATDARVPSGEMLRILVSRQDGSPPIRAEVEVLPSPREGIVAVRWITAASSPDPKPLRSFLQETLVISGGFVEVVDIGGGRREFVFHFPQVSEPPRLPPIDPPAPAPPSTTRQERLQAASTGVALRIKLRLPALYSFDGVDYAGEVVRLAEETVSVVSDGRNVPEMKSHVEVVIGIRDRRDRTHDVTLAGPVVRILSTTPPARFDIAIETVREAKDGVFHAYVQYLFRQAGILPT